ncbi:MAG: uroporphyrinogen III methyltransferase/synthase [Cryomorphaceae bacterium]|jgi:uroporphyrinogen III methyltransferase/synthase
MQGICYLTGAGPGDPDLLTLKAHRCIQQADVVVYDALVNPAILTFVKAGCEMVDVGKRAKCHTMKQEQINQVLVEHTLAGKMVVRLKGGDPMIFGRAGEEAAELAKHGLQFEIIPGISSALAGPVAAGIPLTHRNHGAQLTIFSGHECNKDYTGETALDYQQLATAPGTKVFLMGVSSLRRITEKLISNGAPADTPIAMVRWATMPEQKTIRGTLSTIANIAESTNFASPAVGIIGSVVNEIDNLALSQTANTFKSQISNLK